MCNYYDDLWIISNLINLEVFLTIMSMVPKKMTVKQP